MKKPFIGLVALSFLLVLLITLFSSISTAAQESGYLPLRLAGGEFDPVNEAAAFMMREVAQSQVSPEGEQFYLVQFADTISENDKMALEAAGAELFDYIPDFAFLVRMDAAAETAVSCTRCT